MVQKFPPPPYLPTQDANTQMLNRWLLEIQAILNNSGGVDPNSVAGLPEVITQSGQNTLDIQALEVTTGGQGASIAAINIQITAINGQITTINGQLTSLGARAQPLNGVGAPAAGLGNVNDWYANIGGAVGARIYVKTAPTVWTAFPF